MQKIILVAGARPNFIKIAPLWRAFSQYENVEPRLVHTGQHYDDEMSKVFFDDLGLPVPYYNLNAGGNSHAKQTADIMSRFDEVVVKENPDDVVVVGDVNSTLACALVAAKRSIRTSHVEAGLRSFDSSMPEEINRRVTDAVSDLLFASELSGVKNLKNEGVDEDKVFFVGNVMIDSLAFAGSRINASDVLSKIGLDGNRFALVTIHRPSNVDSSEKLEIIMRWLQKLSKKIEVVFPVHPRTQQKLSQLGWGKDQVNSNSLKFKIISPQGYYNFQKLLKSAQLVITDSGGLQEETTWLGVNCITLRKNTERPVTIEEGTNYLVGDDLKQADKIIEQCLQGKGKKGIIPRLWDGRAASRIVEVIVNKTVEKE
jgi:UDP-N-acetylglucosamine 2-epimerase (non-hydrolysing)